jgi:predicted DNA-binding WGR domain protein
MGSGVNNTKILFYKVLCQKYMLQHTEDIYWSQIQPQWEQLCINIPNHRTYYLANHVVQRMIAIRSFQAWCQHLTEDEQSKLIGKLFTIACSILRPKIKAITKLQRSVYLQNKPKIQIHSSLITENPDQVCNRFINQLVKENAYEQVKTRERQIQKQLIIKKSINPPVPNTKQKVFAMLEKEEFVLPNTSKETKQLLCAVVVAKQDSNISNQSFILLLQELNIPYKHVGNKLMINFGKAGTCGTHLRHNCDRSECLDPNFIKCFRQALETRYTSSSLSSSLALM